MSTLDPMTALYRSADEQNSAKRFDQDLDDVLAKAEQWVQTQDPRPGLGGRPRSRSRSPRTKWEVTADGWTTVDWTASLQASREHEARAQARAKAGDVVMRPA